MPRPFEGKDAPKAFLLKQLGGVKPPASLIKEAEKCNNWYEVSKLAEAYLAGASADNKQPKVEKKVSKGGQEKESIDDKEDS